MCAQWLWSTLRFLLFIHLWNGVWTYKMVTLYWNATNPSFRIDNTDHIIDVNKGNIPFEYDQVNIICPVYQTGTREEDVEQYIIYNVSKEEYDSCRITNPHPRIIAVCDKPHQLMYFTITFRSFTPQPGGLEFRPGQDYYFISTSTGDMDGLHQRIGGRCATHNMKVIFKVCCDPSKSTARPRLSSSSSATPVPGHRRQWGGLPEQNTTRVVPTPARPATTTPHRWLGPLFPTPPPPQLQPRGPVRKTYDVAVADGKKPSKKSDDRDKLPNETRAKNEELVNSQTCLAARAPTWLTFLATTLGALWYRRTVLLQPTR
ncbi:ephrin-B2a-like isoform X2 [Ornithodoros turicata]|uniref:ephrin-B2a-like isoform X2 n=1 Tax=Ornithodoros turicata TaxID=34597 RepID=UPI003138E6FF